MDEHNSVDCWVYGKYNELVFMRVYIYINLLVVGGSHYLVTNQSTIGEIEHLAYQAENNCE